MADESVDMQIVEKLRKDGYQIIYITEIAQGKSDEYVLNLANEESAILITIDKDFGELVFRRSFVSNGVILIRLAGLPQTTKLKIISAAIKEHLSEIPNSFTVISPGSIRIRYRI